MNNRKMGLEAFERLTKQYPKSHLAPVALFHIGSWYVTQEDAEKALEAYRKIVKSYSDTIHGERAKELIKSILKWQKEFQRKS